MLAIVFATFPFFAVVLGGYLATQRGAVPKDAIQGLNWFVLYLALPCFLFRAGSTTPALETLYGVAAGVYLVTAVVMVGGTIALTLGPRIDWNNAAFGALVAAFPNSGYMGVPLLVALFGKQAAGPAIATILIDLVFTSTLCVALSRRGGADKQGAAAATRKVLKGVIANPMPWAIGLGVAFFATGLEFPSPLARTIELLAAAASPVALFTIGAVLARSQMATTVRAPLRDYLPVALLKLVLHPLLVLALGYGAIGLGLEPDRFALKVTVLVAALPSASNVMMLAERFGADSGRIARIILVSTALAFVTFTAAVALLT